MEDTSPFLAMQRVEAAVKALLRQADPDLLSADERVAVNKLRRLSVDARLDIRDYLYSETRPEQLEHAAAARKRLAGLQKAILAAGAVFGPADVAQLTARLEQISERLV